MPDLGQVSQALLNLHFFVLYFACTFMLAFVLGLWRAR